MKNLLVILLMSSLVSSAKAYSSGCSNAYSKVTWLSSWFSKKKAEVSKEDVTRYRKVLKGEVKLTTEALTKELQSAEKTSALILAASQTYAGGSSLFKILQKPEKTRYERKIESFFLKIVRKNQRKLGNAEKGYFNFHRGQFTFQTAKALFKDLHALGKMLDAHSSMKPRFLKILDVANFSDYHLAGSAYKRLKQEIQRQEFLEGFDKLGVIKDYRYFGFIPTRGVGQWFNRRQYGISIFLSAALNASYILGTKKFGLVDFKFDRGLIGGRSIRDPQFLKEAQKYIKKHGKQKFIQKHLPELVSAGREKKASELISSSVRIVLVIMAMKALLESDEFSMLWSAVQFLSISNEDLADTRREEKGEGEDLRELEFHAWLDGYVDIMSEELPENFTELMEQDRQEVTSYLGQPGDIYRLDHRESQQMEKIKDIQNTVVQKITQHNKAKPLQGIGVEYRRHVLKQYIKIYYLKSDSMFYYVEDFM